jgi:hypothetical protein
MKPEAYTLKAAADYETGAAAAVSAARASAAVTTGKRFVAKLAELIGGDAGPAST